MLPQAFRGAAIQNGVPLARVRPDFKDVRATTRDAIQEIRSHCSAHVKQYKSDPTQFRNSCLLDEIINNNKDDERFQVHNIAHFLKLVKQIEELSSA